MKIKLSPLYILSFFALVFLIHEMHDWIHVLVARAVCGCWGTKAFDYWTLCSRATVTSRGNVLITMAGPLFNYLVICWGWELMQPENELHQKSLGFSLVFASLPFPRIMGALAGGGDETSSLKQIFLHADGGNRHFVSLAGLLIVLVLTLPALYRAFMLVAGWWGKLMVLGFLVLPGYVDRLVVGGLLNKMLDNGILYHQVWTGFSQAVMAWLLLLVVLLILTGRYLSWVFEYREVHL